MRKYTLKCTHCDKDMTIRLWGFRRIIVCPSCKTTYYLSTRMWFYVISILVLCIVLTFLQPIFVDVIPSPYGFIVLAIFIYTLLLLMQNMTVAWLGIKRLYRMHDDAYYKKNAAERKKADRTS